MRFNPKLAVLAFATSAVIASFGAQAASIDVKVIGTITPGSCVPTLAGGGTIDYGNIGTAQVSLNTYTMLPEKIVAFTINCDAPAKVAVRSIDNRASSLIPGVVSPIGSGFNDDNFNFGLGAVSGANVGGYAMRMKQGSFVADGVNVATTESSNSGASWLSTGQGTMNKQPTHLMSWALANGGLPIAFSTLSGSFSVQAVLNKGSALPLTNDVPLDGSTTIELVYL